MKSRPINYKRSVLKGLIWESFSFIILFFAVYFVFKDGAPRSLAFTLILTMIKVPFYVGHEKIWKYINYGKRK